MEQEQFIELMKKRPDFRNDLFIRGFLITDDSGFSRKDFPLYGLWNETRQGQYSFLTHSLTGIHFYRNDLEKVFFLLGHAYDPFTMEIDETRILKHIAEAFGTEEYWERINEITGIFLLGFIDGEKIHFLTDVSGIQAACCGRINGKFYCSSHAQLIGDICHLSMSPLVKELVGYKWYGRVLGPYLPADLTPFRELKRIIPGVVYQYNTEVAHWRFRFLRPLRAATEEAVYNQVIQEAAFILKNNMILISRKWKHPWISLTGGIDSNTTFAAGNGVYDRFDAFSYISSKKEVPDTEAAAKIAQKFKMKHHVFHVPHDNAEVKDFDTILKILRHNSGYIAEPPSNEARKRIILRRNARCDVEVKSWVSETIRGYWYKYYGRKSMPELSGKLFRNLYKIFIMNRSLAHKIDRLFTQYILDYEYNRIPAC